MREVSTLRTEALGEAPASEASASAEAPVSREQLRSRRKREVRARTVSMKRMTKRELALGRMLYPEDEDAGIARPRTRADCWDDKEHKPIGVRPCPFVSCKHHLYLDVSAKTGAIKLNFPDLEVDELPVSCVLDVAAKGGVTLEKTGEIMNLTRERVRQIEVNAFARAQACADMTALREHLPIGETKRRLPILSEDEDGEEDEHNEDAAAGDEVDPERFASAELDDDGR